MAGRCPIRCRLAGLAVIAVLPLGVADAQNRVVEEVRVVREGEQTIVRIELACQMRFVADTATGGGALLEVRVAPFDSCRQQGLLSGLETETYRPVGAEAAGLTTIEFSTLGLGDGLLLLSFERPVRYAVTQRPTLRSIEIAIESVADILPDDGRRPLSVRVVEPVQTPDYIVNLLSTRDPVDADTLSGLLRPAGSQVYVSQIEVDGEIWNRVRLGFFASEAEAREALENQGGNYPRAWIGRAEPAEIALARAAPLTIGNGPPPTLRPEPVVPAAAPGAAAATPDEIAERMAAARVSLRDGDPAAAIAAYRGLLEVPGPHRAEALEMIGLAYERNGQTALARGAWEQSLREFPSDPGRARVEQRLRSLPAAAVPAPTLREASGGTSDAWDLAVGLAQYYRRDDYQSDADRPSVTTQSALLTDFDVSVGHAGRNLDLDARLSLNHYHDLLEPEEGGRGDQQRFSFAYFDIAAVDQDWDLRLGRQSLHTFGVLGRFDGAHGSYALGPDKRLHLMAGYPVESSRDGVETDRRFVGLAAEFDDLVGSWDFASFLNTQTIEGIDARFAVGMEARYFDERRSLTAMLDYDIDFSELNMALVLGTWRLPNRVTLSALVDQRQAPILTTRNALIGQPVETVTELLLVWTEDEIRRLAADRSASSDTLTLGVAAPLGERLQVNFDLTSSEIGATQDSGGVPGVPATGRQSFVSTSLVATGLFASADVNVWHLQVGDAGTYETKTLTWDARFPVGRRLRINPRLRFALWQDVAADRERQSVSPALRLLLNARNRYRLELEVGRDATTRTDPTAERESSGRYLYLGYQAYF